MKRKGRRTVKDVLGLINLWEEDRYLEQLTYDRAVAALHFGGRYRLIDFILSGMVNSGIKNVAVFPKDRSRSLMDHLRSGKEWDLDRKRDGLSILPSNNVDLPTGSYRGDLEMFHTHRDFFHNSRQSEVVIAGSNMVCNIDFEDVVQQHRNSGADITVVYANTDGKVETIPPSNGVWLETDSRNRVVSMEIGSEPRHCSKMSMNMFVMSKALLLKIMDECLSRGEYDLLRSGIIRELHKLTVLGYCFDGFVEPVTTISGYYRANMELLHPHIWRELFFDKGQIYTKVKDEAPTKYCQNSRVVNSQIASGSLIKGRVENSIIFRKVTVEQDAMIKNSIILPRSIVKENAHLENTILNKEVQVGRFKSLKGEASYPFVIGRKSVI